MDQTGLAGTNCVLLCNANTQKYEHNRRNVKQIAVSALKTLLVCVTQTSTTCFCVLPCQRHRTDMQPAERVNLPFGGSSAVE